MNCLMFSWFNSLVVLLGLIIHACVPSCTLSTLSYSRCFLHQEIVHCLLLPDGACLGIPGTHQHLARAESYDSGVLGSMMIPSQTFLGKAEQNEWKLSTAALIGTEVQHGGSFMFSGSQTQAGKPLHCSCSAPLKAYFLRLAMGLFH